MLKSEMIECESNEMSIEEDENIVEHVMDFLHLGWTGVYSRELLISLQNTTQFDDESLGYAMIGMSEILQLIEKADEFGIPCLIEAIAQTMNEYNAMIYVKKSLTIIDELRAIIWDHAARIVAENITCVISDHIYDCENYRESGGSWSYPTLDQHIERENNLRSWYERLSITNVVEQLVLFQKNIFIHAITTLPLDFLLKVLKCESFSENTHNVIAYICMWLLQNFTDDNDNSLEQIFQILRSIDLAACSLEFINLFIVRIFMELLKMRGLTELYNNTSSLVIRSALNMLQGTNVRHMINDISETLLNSMLKQFHHHYQNNAENCPSFNEAVLRLWLRNIDRKSWNEFQLVHQDPFNSITSKLLNTIETNHHFKQYTLDLMGACLTHVLEETFPQSSRHPNHSMNKHQIPKTEQLHQKVLLLGLDDSGKTSLLYKLTNKENQDQYSTIGYNAEKALFGPVVLNIWDIGGSLIMRPLWKQFINDCDALIYVIDASNPDRFHEALESLDTYLDYSLLKPGCSFIIYANKMDLVSNKTQRVREIRTIFSEKSKLVSKVEIRRVLSTTPLY
ncbi:hypothetical protein C9374_002129 [Naegleria lovaniensis]|uniref:Uncharacterized protein n=1 Tax=Naegleria lovaniensis TaxID=51637 RepID=A0AA88GWM4_NAELO|nr:uncharacterized protein C9374_002129 [Naegleria lovaniensis]KAG2387094.1 hypothetical protein C9374_002129 [Naegleria lovaniensis]